MYLLWLTAWHSSWCIDALTNLSFIWVSCVASDAQLWGNVRAALTVCAYELHYLPNTKRNSFMLSHSFFLRFHCLSIARRVDCTVFNLALICIILYLFIFLSVGFSEINQAEQLFSGGHKSKALRMIDHNLGSRTGSRLHHSITDEMLFWFPLKASLFLFSSTPSAFWHPHSSLSPSPVTSVWEL